GITYQYTITALGPLGETGRSNVVSMVYVTPPEPPTGLTGVAGCETVNLTWTAPSYTGGMALTGFHVFKGATNVTLEYLATVGLDIGFTDNDVENGITYHYAVSAFNAIGNSTLAPAISAYPTGPPTVPLAFEVIPGDENVTLRWQPPANVGGIPLWGYSILRSFTPDYLLPVDDVDDLVTEYVDTRLENGVTYHYAVQAYNALGYGPRSPVVSVVPVGPPGIPGLPEFSLDLGLVELLWEPPGDEGGSRITAYTVYRGISLTHLAPVGQTTNLWYQDMGAPTGNSLYYAISANNSVGEGPLTPAIEVWPIDNPEGPRDLVTEGGRNAITLTWQPPLNDGGSEITGYRVMRNISMGEFMSQGSVDRHTLTFVDTDVISGVTYRYYISVITVLGFGTSTEAWAIAYTVPSPPSKVSFVRDGGPVSISWSPPDFDGGRPVVTYRVYRGT
ncbi:MAG: fibronectin type III domain-containing protein, partial [Thermoplasmata archaeon]|nr:fibronectin type III domain-containing protein [Thermoplasmata archaeon]